VASTAARISEINRRTWEDVRWDIDWQKECRHLPLDPEEKDAVRTPRWVPVIERVEQALQYA
jgi:hypothetical protein